MINIRSFYVAKRRKGLAWRGWYERRVQFLTCASITRWPIQYLVFRLAVCCVACYSDYIDKRALACSVSFRKRELFGNFVFGFRDLLNL